MSHIFHVILSKADLIFLGKFPATTGVQFGVARTTRCPGSRGDIPREQEVGRRCPNSGDLLCARDAAFAHPDNTGTPAVAGPPESAPFMVRR
jgi:hypothetical protein